MTTIDKQNKESLEEKISKFAETLAGIQERAVIEYLKTKDYVFETDFCISEEQLKWIFCSRRSRLL